ncbi:MAG TPA: AI-2E family transporter [Polyangiaceae bacterium]|nr:AI-2E family transporter [Polyangiaceae bacterium]
MPTEPNLSLAADPEYERPVVASPPPLGAGNTTARRRPGTERTALGVLAIAAVAILAWLASPVAVGVFMGCLVAFTMDSFHQKLLVRGLRPWLAALSAVSVATLGVIAAASAMGYLLVSRGVVIAGGLLDALGPEGAVRAFILRTSARFPRELQAESLIAKLRDAAAELTTSAGLIAGAVVNATFSALVGWIFMVLTMYFVLRHWPLLVRRAEELLPLHPRHSHALLEEFRSAGRTTLLGTVVTGLVQGGLAAVGYWVLGVPEPAFFGAATAVASLLPVVGTVLVWLPAGLFLIAIGQVGKGISELAYGLLVVVGVSDYFIRPKLVGAKGDMPVLLTLIALFGGLELFGIIGLILGPVLMVLARAILRLYAAEKRNPPPLVNRNV